jgi:hypothetical protein
MNVEISDRSQIGRLALRVEGENWVAYWALTDSMQDPVFLGSIRMGAIVNNSTRKSVFMAMMQDICSDLIEEKMGERPTWGEPNRAPEHERAGRS